MSRRSSVRAAQPMLFHRQKVVLSLLEAAGRPVERLELMKWAFLLRHESPSAGGRGFYGFVPYHYGPFSFALQRDLSKLCEGGFLAMLDEHRVALLPTARVLAIEPEVRADTRVLARRFSGAADSSTVIDHVYERFPEFAVNSRRRNRPQVEPRVAEKAVHTAGYEGLSVDDFLNLLVQSGIRSLADVRRNPVARRYGFHRSSLSQLCGKLGISYAHFPELGIASEWRQDLATQEAREKLFARYEGTTLATEGQAIQAVANLCLAKPTVLVCMEARPCECHRTRLASAVSNLTGLPVRHLVAGES